MIFQFESDFAGSLRCIPMIVRRKLDLIGVKMTLRQWNRLPREGRGELVEKICETESEQAAYRDLVLHMIGVHTDEPPHFLAERGLEDWMAADRMPEAVTRQARCDGVPAPTAAQWAALSPLQRFALVKLARSTHENENFLPAMREFGVV